MITGSFYPIQLSASGTPIKEGESTAGIPSFEGPPDSTSSAWMEYRVKSVVKSNAVPGIEIGSRGELTLSPDADSVGAGFSPAQLTAVIKRIGKRTDMKAGFM